MGLCASWTTPGRTVVLRACRCGTCGRGHLRKMPPVVKMVYDFAGGNSMDVECVAYVMARESYKRCGGMITTATAPAIPGFIGEYYVGRCTDHTISYFFEALYGFALSTNAVWNARRAIKDLLKGNLRGDPTEDNLRAAPTSSRTA